MTTTQNDTAHSSGFAPVLTRAAEAETTRDPSSVMTLLADSGNTGGRLTGYRSTYLRLLGRVMRGEADPQEIKDSSERFDNHYVDSPVWREALATRA
ncbi:hypothetical protein [Streptomyces iakyrus]|uniref:hypothetical protein n=1 Tax=Streptomyces iakyrus TaxID=68219 RepID=UPI003D91DEC5